MTELKPKKIIDVYDRKMAEEYRQLSNFTGYYSTVSHYLMMM